MSPPPPPSKRVPAAKLDVQSPAAALTQSPFAGLLAQVVAAPPSAAAPPPAAAARPAPAARRRPPVRLTLRRETKHRGGKTVVIISGFVDRSAQVLGELEKLLKQRLGCGGSCDPQAGEILIQGDRAAEVAAVLGQLGYEVRGVAKP